MRRPTAGEERGSRRGRNLGEEQAPGDGPGPGQDPEPGQDPRPVWLWWSTGKDAAWALHRLRSDPAWARYRVTGLVTTVEGAAEANPAQLGHEERGARVAVHGVPAALARAQAQAVGLPLHLMPIPPLPPNAVYEAAVERVVDAAREAGVLAMAFGDLHLADIRVYREGLMARAGMEALFPVWGEDTDRLAREMIDGGLVARVVAVDRERLSQELVGRPFDHRLLADLPAGVDRCGENGEFHTCVLGGPGFRRTLPWPRVG